MKLRLGVLLIGGVVLAAAAFAVSFRVHSDRVAVRLPEDGGREDVDQAAIPAALDSGGKRTEMVPAISRLNVLKSLPYLPTLRDARSQLRGVLVFDKEKAQPGVNFYNSYKRSAAYLIDMEGDVLHRWAYEYPGDASWHHAELLNDGTILVVVRNHGVIKLDPSSELLWTYESTAHHDLWVADDGDIYLLTRALVEDPEIHPANRILDDRITILDPHGRMRDEFSILEVLRASGFDFLLASVAEEEFPSDAELDLVHTNHVEVFDGSLVHLSPLFERGNMLISMKLLNAVAIIDGSTRRIIWLWGPNNLALQHHPTLLENGNILIFDNGTTRSQIVELDPLTLEVVWRYHVGKFLSRWGGSVQRLANGNTLVTDTETGYVTEVDRDGEIIWRFANPDVSEDGERWNIWRMTRLDPSTLTFLRPES